MTALQLDSSTIRGNCNLMKMKCLSLHCLLIIIFMCFVKTNIDINYDKQSK